MREMGMISEVSHLRGLSKKDTIIWMIEIVMCLTCVTCVI